ncbi:DUF4231 domain-containing protein [Mycoplasma sp. Pen4]|uniref:DUF4231 domain-containing protein n=1 Tax=Mycoplasma sp. Pen4 TaxID=640330 RepID=UPI001654068B|nr:DUF4231 domain-containing protein [Mycoplasma sp. Pen4]QNM93732.1 DUF4231 domain-containing protein [Mycoplasma sp. Pen4]
MQDNKLLNQIKKIYKDNKRLYYLYLSLYYFLNLLTIFAAFIIGVVAVYYLAGSNKYEVRKTNNPWFNHVLVGVGFYPILITTINSFIGFISGVLSFFVVNKKYQAKKLAIQKIKLEIIMFESDLSIYKNINDIDKKVFALYERVLGILQYDKLNKEQLFGVENETREN